MIPKTGRSEYRVRIEKAERILAKAAERRERAAVRLADYTGPKWHFAILGLKTRVKTFEFKVEDTALASLKRIEEQADVLPYEELIQAKHA